MTFTRTKSGLKTLHIFFKVDKVVFCEGGPSIQVADVLRGSGADSSLDVMYWTNISSFLGAQKKYHFKSIGSKTTALSLAKDVVAANITTVIVCLDSDFDGFLGKLIDHANVVYTYGYSWENDVLQFPAITEAVYCMIPRDDKSKSLLCGIEKLLNKIDKDLIRWCEVDIYLLSKGKAALFVRSNPLSLHRRTSGMNTLHMPSVKGRLGALGYRQAPPRKIRISSGGALRHSFGRLISHLVYELVVSTVKSRDNSVSISQKLFMRLCINGTLSALKSGGLEPVANHFERWRTTFE